MVYKDSSLSATLPVKCTQPKNEFKFFPKVRASREPQFSFCRKQSFMNFLYLLVSRGQSLDEGHSGIMIVALAFWRLS